MEFNEYNIKALNDVYKNAHIALQSISDLLPSVENEEIKKELSELDKEKVLAIAKEKGNQLKDKCEELVAYAKEKGTPVVEKTAREVKAKTAEVVRGVLEKLED